MAEPKKPTKSLVPLTSVKILKEENWSDVNQNMRLALNEMRIDWDSHVKMKEIKDVQQNPLLERRRRKTPNTQQTDHQQRDNKQIETTPMLLPNGGNTIKASMLDLKTFTSMPIKITPMTTNVATTVATVNAVNVGVNNQTDKPAVVTINTALVAQA